MHSNMRAPPGNSESIRGAPENSLEPFCQLFLRLMRFPSRYSPQLFRYLPVFGSEFFIFIAGPLIGSQACDQVAFGRATLQQFNFPADVNHGCSNALAAAVSAAAREIRVSDKTRGPRL